MKCMFKVWSCDRSKKTVIVSEPNLTLIIAKATEKLGIHGSIVALEEDGSIITDDDVLEFLVSNTSSPPQVLLILNSDEKWEPPAKSILEKTTENTSVIPPASEDSSAEVPSVLSDVRSEEMDECDLSISSNKESNFKQNRRDSNSLEDTIENPSKKKKEDDVSLSSTAHSSNNNNIINWEDFEISWPKEGEIYSNVLRDGKRDKFVVNHFVRIIVDQMRNFHLDLKKKDFVAVAKQMVHAYPKTFMDIDDDGKRFGEGFYIIKKKLKDRSDYLVSLTENNFLKETKKLAVSSQKTLTLAKAGCSKNWQPEKHPEGETEKTVKEKQKLLDEYILQLTENFDLNHHLEATYTAQRLFLNNFKDFPNIEDVINEWAMLIIPENLYWHYEKLMSHDITQVTDKMISKYEKIFTFNDLKFNSKTMLKTRKMKKKLPKKKKNQIATVTNSEKEQVPTEAASEKVEETITLLQFEKTTDPSIMCEQIINIVSNYFREYLQVFCLQVQVSF